MQVTFDVRTTPDALTNLRQRLNDAVKTILAPPPRLNLSEWANEHRYLSKESSPEPGKFRWQRAPYMREMLDVAGDYRTERMVVMSSAQIGKTTILENIVAYYIANDPSPILVVLPELTTAKAFSTDRIDPMLRDTPILAGRVREKRSRDSGNTLLQKRFVGGHLTIIGSNSASGLRGRPIRVLLLDEVDAYPLSAGKEGDPVNLAVARTSNFWNRKVILTSTPTVKDLSRIEKEFLASDQRYYHVPCPHCHELDRLTWDRIKYENHDPHTAFCVCLKCGCAIEEAEKGWMLARGQWIAANPNASVAGFHLSALYSPWRTWKELVAQWLEDKQSPETLRVFVNVVLGECWNDNSERVEAHHLVSHLEDYEAEVPTGVGVLTCGVDVQGDRLEYYVWGWGAKEESWLIDYGMILKDPGTEAAWADLTMTLQRRYTTKNGAEVKISAIGIDTGHQSEHVERAVMAMRRQGLTVFAMKGHSAPDFPLARRTKKVVSVGGNTAKDMIHSRFKIASAGPGYVHLPRTVDLYVLNQLTAERRVSKYVNGRRYFVWENPKKERNEALDCLVYAMAALSCLGANTIALLGKIAEHVAQKSAPETPTEAQPAPTPAPPALPPSMHQRRRPQRMQSGLWSSGFNL